MIVGALINYICDTRFLYQLLVALIIFCAIQIYHLIQARRSFFKLFSKHGIPGPKPNIFNGNLSTFKIGVEKSYYLIDHKLWKQYGKVYGFFAGIEPIMVVTDLEMLRKIFFEETKVFQDRSENLLDLPVTQGILFAKYPKWKIMRKVLSPPFSLYKMRGSSSTQFIEDSVKLMINYIDERLDDADKENRKADIDILDLMKSTALHLISSLAIKLPNVQVKENEENVKSLDTFLSKLDKGVVIFAVLVPSLRPLVEFIASRFEYNSFLSRIHNGLNKIIETGIAKLSKNKSSTISEIDDQSNILDPLIRMYHEGQLTRDEVLGSADSLLFAGYDTTSTTLAYIFWALSKYPEIQEQLRSELMAHGVESKYLEQVIKETMRLYPVAINFTSRLATATVQIGDWTIPKGVKVSYHAWIMGRNPDIWPEPDKFDPERFREGVEIHPCAYAPFGMGEKKCLGYNLAMLEMKMVICDILVRYRLKLKSPHELTLISYAIHLSKPSEKVMIELERI